MKQFTLRDTVLRLTSVLSKLVLCTVALVFVTGSVRAQDAAATNGEKAAQASVDPQTVIALEKRVKNLEQQIIDLRAMIGTFASMGPRANNSGYQGQSDNQVSRDRSRLPTSVRNRAGAADQPGRFPSDTSEVSRAELPLPPKRPDLREDGFSSDQMASAKEQVGPSLRGSTSAEPDNRDAQALYKDAYSHMLRRDYASAQSAFSALLKNHPQSRMAGNAQYWLGETYYVRGKYRPAADAFLKAYQNHSKGIKAPDSLMKLALSLSRLGQKNAACNTFDELDNKYPNAPSHVKQRAGMERRRAGCN